MQNAKRATFFSDVENSSIEEIRLIATTLLVAYHVIGQPGTGLHLASPHPLRIFADLLSDFRMPAFAFIAGFIYALRPPSMSGFRAFTIGKLRRLAIPGLIAALTFAIIGNMFHLESAIPIKDLWQILFYPYVHYWFLQAILALFVIIGLADTLTHHKAEIPLLGIAILLSVSGVTAPTLFSLQFAVHLAPFFLVGMCYHRHSRWIEQHYRSITLIAIALIALWVALTVTDYSAPGEISDNHSPLRALMFGTSVCTLLLFYLPHHPFSRVLGRYSFTIYLYHVLGTAGMRMVLHKLGIPSVSINFVFGVAAGLLFPIAIHLAASRSPMASQLLLGIKRKKTPAAVALRPAISSSDV
jgi:hypothetical protein